MKELKEKAMKDSVLRMKYSWHDRTYEREQTEKQCENQTVIKKTCHHVTAMKVTEKSLRNLWWELWRMADRWSTSLLKRRTGPARRVNCTTYIGASPADIAACGDTTISTWNWNHFPIFLFFKVIWDQRRVCTVMLLETYIRNFKAINRSNTNVQRKQWMEPTKKRS